ncbi:Rv3654c family TadE-like protein [Streptoalloteichus hindustanus]|uniref:Rv3654c family TadE-like protein n=1 Tax=Streptoalloteichus hindustanus TaxID=2017 RepID=UPI001F3E611D|nr:Rv3654c family TadE-like protein [Streptoalloteichus hindustanus]
MTLLAVAAMLAFLLITAVAAQFGAATITRRRAESAADLAALAAAAHALSGVDAACDRARWIAENMRVHVTNCRLEQWDALVEIRAAPSGPLGGFPAANARARAGPRAPA